MWDNSFDMKVESKKDLIKLVKRMNEDIEFKNITRPDNDKLELLDLDYILKRYKTIKYNDDLKTFREEHDCKYCLYYEKPRRCKAKKKCPLDSEEDFEEKKIVQKIKCPKDKEGNCPYGNEVGTCFGFCMQKIVNEFKEERRSGKQ
ncbi:MAG: hypothetical protein ACK5ML_10355 [Lachnospiraceae bacterium]